MMTSWPPLPVEEWPPYGNRYFLHGIPKAKDWLSAAVDPISETYVSPHLQPHPSHCKMSSSTMTDTHEAAFDALASTSSALEVVASNDAASFAVFSSIGSSTAGVAIIFDERMLLHITSPLDFKREEDMQFHCEHHNRVLGIFHRLRTQGLLNSPIRLLPARMATEADLLRVHPQTFIEKVRTFDLRPESEVPPEGRLHLDSELAKKFASKPSSMIPVAVDWYHRDVYEWKIHPAAQDTYAGPFTPAVAQLAAGGVLQAVDAVIRDGCSGAFAIVRPPGHHCHLHQAGGFCFYNNIAVAARYAQSTYGTSHNCRKVAIIDFDIHHGDGTQNIFYDDGSVLFISIHRFDGSFYPGTGPASEVGAGAGAGFNVNIPFDAKGLGEVEYSVVFEQVVLPMLVEFGPDMILVSAGFDAALGDTLGEMALLPESYGLFVSMLCALRPRCGVVVALEGGYNIASISRDAEQCVRALLAAPPPSSSREVASDTKAKPALPRPPIPSFVHTSALSGMRAVATAHAPYWSSMRELLEQLQATGAKAVGDAEVLHRMHVSNLEVALAVTPAYFSHIQTEQRECKERLDMDALVTAPELPSACADDVDGLSSALASMTVQEYVGPTVQACLGEAASAAAATTAAARTRAGKKRLSEGGSPKAPKPSNELGVVWCKIGSGDIHITRSTAGVVSLRFLRSDGQEVASWALKGDVKVDRKADFKPELQLECADGQMLQLYARRDMSAAGRVALFSDPAVLCRSFAARGATFAPTPIAKCVEALTAASKTEVADLHARFKDTDIPIVAFAYQLHETRCKDVERNIKTSLPRNPSTPRSAAAQSPHTASTSLTISFDKTGEVSVSNATSVCSPPAVLTASATASAAVVNTPTSAAVASSSTAEDGTTLSKPWKNTEDTEFVPAYSIFPGDSFPVPAEVGAKSFIAVYAAEYAAGGDSRAPFTPVMPVRAWETFAAKMGIADEVLVRHLPVSAPVWTLGSDNTVTLCGPCRRSAPFYFLAAKDEHSLRQIASLTKIMTCIVVFGIVDALNAAAPPAVCTAPDSTFQSPPPGLDVKITISARAAACVGGTVAGVKEGDVYTAWDLLYGMMLPSGNDAATALAEHFGVHCRAESESTWTPFPKPKHYDGVWEREEPISRFVAEMNRTARALGMTSTTFANPHGLASPITTSCASDVLKMVMSAWSDSRFRTLVGTRSCVAEFQLKHEQPTPKVADDVGAAELQRDDSFASMSDLVEAADTPVATPASTPAAATTAARAARTGDATRTFHPNKAADGMYQQVVWENSNNMLRPSYVNGVKVDGIKTGITPVAGGCLATHATFNGNLLSHNDDNVRDGIFCVTLGSASKMLRFVHTTALIRWADKAVSLIQSS